MTTPRVVPLYCAGGYVGDAVSATGFFRLKCRERRCRAPDGSMPVHVFDLETGWLVNEQPKQSPEVAERTI